LLFGGKRLPGIATGLGTAIRNFKGAMKEGEQEENKKIASATSQNTLPPEA